MERLHGISGRYLPSLEHRSRRELGNKDEMLVNFNKEKDMLCFHQHEEHYHTISTLIRILPPISSTILLVLYVVVKSLPLERMVVLENGR